MASFNDPKLSNHIADDVPAIRQLLRSVAALDPETGNTDIPNGAKRLVETAQGYEFQSYNGTSWTTLEKWNIDVQKVDGYSASTGTTANTIPVRDANGKIPGDITGNADTATKANELSEVNPIAMGGTGAITAEQARNNLEVPPKGHASASTTYGVGTGGMYGHVKLSDYASDLYGVPEGIAATPLAVSNAQAEAVSEASNMFSSLDDTLRALIDEELAKYLKLSGGTMKGVIIVSGTDDFLKRDVNNGRLVLFGGNDWTKCAYIEAYGGDNSGQIRLHAKDGTNNTAFVLFPTGGATIAGKEVLTIAGGTLSGNLTFSNSATQIGRTVSNGITIINGGEGYSGGASLYLYGKDHASTPGLAYIRVTNSEGAYELRMNPTDGALTWGGKNVVRSVNSVSANAAGNVTINALNSSTVKVYSTASATLPSGGTWAVVGHSSGDGHDDCISGTYSGGTKVTMSDFGGDKFILAIKIA